MIRLENVKIYEDLEEKDVVKQACKKYKINFDEVKEYVIFKKSIDARDKNNIFYNYTIDIDYIGKKKFNNLKVVSKENFELKIPKVNPPFKKTIIIGAGPAGLFCGLILVQNGIKPIIIEQGKTSEERKKDVEDFFATRKVKCKFKCSIWRRRSWYFFRW